MASLGRSVGNGHENRGVHFMVGRKTIHPHKHFKGLEGPGIFQLCGRLVQYVVLIVLDNAVETVVICHILLEGGGVHFRHPAAENVQYLLIVLGTGRQLSHIEIRGKSVQLISGA